MERELESSVALCENILQMVQKADEEREQLAMQLQVQAKEPAELNEQLKLSKQAGVCMHNIMYVECVCVFEIKKRGLGVTFVGYPQLEAICSSTWT